MSGSRDVSAPEASVSSEPAWSEFDRSFARAAARVRAKLALSRALGGATIGGALTVAAAGVAWWLRRGDLRLWSVSLVGVGALAALVGSRAWRWSDEEVALFLDEAHASSEAIVTASGVADRSSASARTVLLSARAALERPGASPRALRPWHALLPVALALAAWLVRLPLPPSPADTTPRPSGVEAVALEGLEGLEEVKALARLEARDEEQRRRLRELAGRAERLEKRLAEGMPRREAQAEIARLRQDVAAERQKLGAGGARAGLEAALGKLAKEPRLADAQKALGDRDLTGFDREMAELANRLEEKDRARAREALEEAAAAARREGAPELARELEEQARRLADRGAGAEALRKLADALGDDLPKEGRDALEGMRREGGERERSELGRQLAEALSDLDDEELKRLARKLAAAAKESPPGAAGEASREELERLQRELATPEGRRELAARLRELARAPEESPEARRDRGLDEAERGLGRGEARLQGTPVPTPGATPGQGRGKPGQGTPGAGRDATSGGKPDSGTPSAGRGGGAGTHGGGTAPVDGDSLRAHANAPLNAAAPNPGGVVGRAPGVAGETARIAGEGRLGEVAPGAVEGASRSEIPREYREQVGRYFPAR
ncbi:MAG: hypothetical protein FJ095_07435 [Deltaproteobacteria bacterium]|nr:hypothetical protein [Deltaproteobacteria bacterium]